MAALAFIEPRDRIRSRRSSARRRLNLEVKGAVPNGSAAEVMIHDLSITGLLVETLAELTCGEELDVCLPQTGRTRAKVMWSSGQFFGCQFSHPISSAALSAAMLRSRPIEAQRPDDPPRTNVIYPEPDRTDSSSRPQLSFGAKMRVILGLSIACWTVIGGIVWAARSGAIGSH